ncbi:DUF5825 family protein [Streptomyces sp. NPDC006733]|uniref:DUF5825 family protein n=1 Tax=Streptomyces sp. NPDC006733 TaxID=3155460 RepID=UPI00340E0D5F
MTFSPPALSLRLWRDYDPDVLSAVPADTDLGATSLPTGADAHRTVRAWYARGVRRVGLREAVAPADPASVPALVLIRELTAYGLVADWRLRVDGPPGSWRALGHLYPPVSVETADPGDGERIHREWRSGYRREACVYRNGPGFVQIRDRRGGRVQRITIDDPAFLQAIATLLPGADRDRLDPTVLAALASADLIAAAGGRAWWLPHRTAHRPATPVAA